MSVKSNKTFVGFWPIDDNHSYSNLIFDDYGKVDENSRKKLFENLYHHKEKNWEIIISKDYLCQFYLEDLQQQLVAERQNNAASEITNMTLKDTRKVQFKYLEVLNAFYFLLYSSCFTGHNNVFLHDFFEITLWDCLALTFSDTNKVEKSMSFGREQKKQLLRSGNYIRKDIIDRFHLFNCKSKKGKIYYLKVGRIDQAENVKNRIKVDLNIFKDAIQYWKIIFNSGLISLSALGSKILSEHRLENYNVSIALSWFEIEKWIMYWAGVLDVQIYQTNNSGAIQRYSSGDPKPLGIKRIIDSFPDCSIINNLSSELHSIREIRNNIAHNGIDANHQESAKAIELFMNMFNLRSGLNLNINSFRTPSFGM